MVKGNPRLMPHSTLRLVTFSSGVEDGSDSEDTSGEASPDSSDVDSAGSGLEWNNLVIK